jgi:hypothetical protein
MKLRDHTTPENSARRTSAFEIVFTGDETEPLTAAEQDAAETQPITPLWIADGTPLADEHIRRLQEIGLITPDVDGDDDNDGL